MPIDSAIIETSISTGFTVYYYFEIGFDDPMRFLYGNLAGFLLVLGRIFVALAVAEGLAGPAQAIMSTNSVYIYTLAIILDNQVLTNF